MNKGLSNFCLSKLSTRPVFSQFLSRSTNPFTISEPRDQEIGKFLCSSGTLCDGFGSPRIVKRFVGRLGSRVVFLVEYFLRMLSIQVKETSFGDSRLDVINSCRRWGVGSRDSCCSASCCCWGGCRSSSS